MTIDDAMAGVVLSLFGRAAPISGESLVGLIARTAVENDHERLAPLLKLARIDTPLAAFVPFTFPDRAPELATRLSADLETIQSRMHTRIESDTGLHLIDWYGTPLERRFVEVKARRFSPTALRRSPHHRAIWMLRPLTFCPATHFNTPTQG